MDGLRSAGVLTSGSGKVGLVRPSALPETWNPAEDDRISVWEVTCQLARVLSAEDGGVAAAARLSAAVQERGDVDMDAVQLLAYRLYELMQDRRPEDARLFNALGGTWTEIQDETHTTPVTPSQGTFDLGGE